MNVTLSTPKNVMKIKTHHQFQPKRTLTRLNSITYKVDQSGAIIPVANLKPVKLSGVTVKRVSLYNAEAMNRLNLRIGDFVYIERREGIMPEITGVNTFFRKTSQSEEIKFITHCPECGSKLIRRQDETTFYCPNKVKSHPQV